MSFYIGGMPMGMPRQGSEISASVTVTMMPVVYVILISGLGNMKLLKVVVLLVALLGFVFSPVHSRPTNSMTRIQEVFRTLMGSKPMVAHRGKKNEIRNPDTPPEEYENNLRLLWLLNQQSLLAPEAD
uniref:Transmembrane protein 154 n=1 Tax=Bursaphelenchus xylophilus TaxID=6326 RepID=A0A1I7RR31_BURXY